MSWRARNGLARKLLVAGLCALSGSAVLAQTTTRVSVNSSGAQANGVSGNPVLSANERYVAFQSLATNLVPGDTNGVGDVFVRDLLAGTTTRASVDSAGVQGNGASSTLLAPAISADGRYVAFSSVATNLVTGDTNATYDVFVRDFQTGATVRASVDSAGVEGNGLSNSPAISADGRYVAFASTATNLVTGDANGTLDIFLRDLQTGTTTRVNVGPGGAEANDGCGQPTISADGRYVAFWGHATNLVPLDTNGVVYDAFVRDVQAGTTIVVSVDSSGVQGDVGGRNPGISADGRFVAFASVSSNLVAGDTNGFFDIFVRDLQLGTTTRVSVDSSGAQADGNSDHASPPMGNRYVVFRSEAENLVLQDTNEVGDFFMHDLQSGVTIRESVTHAGGQANGDSGGSIAANAEMVSADGRYAVFQSSSTNLVPGDTNGVVDIFLRDLDGGPGFTSLCEPGVAGVAACPCSNPPSGSGRGCNNSASTGGAALSAAGATSLSSDSLVFTTSGEKPTATSVLLQGTTVLANGVVYGQGVRCVGGILKRLFTKTASGGSITAPEFGAGDPTVSARSAAKGNVISPGQSRWYLVFYRDPIVLGGCPSGSTFNATQTGRIDWAP